MKLIYSLLLVGFLMCISMNVFAVSDNLTSDRIDIKSRIYVLDAELRHLQSEYFRLWCLVSGIDSSVFYGKDIQSDSFVVVGYPMDGVDYEEMEAGDVK